MGTLDFFLDKAGGENIEATHQRILAWLLQSQIVVKEMLGLVVKNPTTATEVFGKLFDIQVSDKHEIKALIEIKMWAALSKKQQDRQQDKAEQLKTRLYYFLFGISGLERIPDRDSTTLTMTKVATKLKSLKVKAKEIAKELGDLEPEKIISFFDSYANRLEYLNNWLINEAWKPEFYVHPTRTSHFASIFYKLKLEINNHYKNQYNPLIYRTGRGDVNLDIRKKNGNNKNENQEVVINGEKGNLVFWLKNKKLQIFFHSAVSKGIPRISAESIQEIFRKYWTGPNSGKMPTHRAVNVKWVCLLSVEYGHKEIKTTEQFNEIVKYIKLYHDNFWAIKQKIMHNSNS